ncbi:hypothetical protein BBP40_006797 [Aspergillus hancockii]|nr:hypothetical protein BBP40_006797 [Aspergillus hancockii]
MAAIIPTTIYLCLNIFFLLPTLTTQYQTHLRMTFLQPPTKNTPILLDNFEDRNQNSLGAWHGALEDLPFSQGRDTQGQSYIRLYPTDPDQTYHTQLSSTQCFDLTPYKTWFLHISFTGHANYDISLHQHNPSCNPSTNPYPETWDTIQASRYVFPLGSNDVYIPLFHFNIDLARVVSIAIGGFYPPYDPVTVYKVEFVSDPPRGFQVPEKLPNGILKLRCTRPGSFAFGIDDGIPGLAGEVMEILESEGVSVTFFVVGKGLRHDKETGFREFYREMLKRGHQIALHSDVHLKMEAMDSIDSIDKDIINNLATFKTLLGIESRYFRPPYGTIGARTRQRLAIHIRDPQIVNWSVDIEDWMWADSETPERQLEAFYRDVERGGNLAVLHYCLEDPAAPRLD